MPFRRSLGKCCSETVDNSPRSPARRWVKGVLPEEESRRSNGVIGFVSHIFLARSAGAHHGYEDLTEQGKALRAQMRPFLALCAGLVGERAGA
jgi:hypothetical protein